MIKRRTFLKISLLGFMSVSTGLLYKSRWNWLPVWPLSEKDRAFVSRVVDLLVPADDVSPGALELGVHETILTRAKDNKTLRNTIKNGRKWFDEQSESLNADNFLGLDEAKQITLIEKAEASTIQSTGNKFFSRMRVEVFKEYYSSPESWISLCYQGPPQPNGFLDYAEPPRGCT